MTVTIRVSAQTAKVQAVPVNPVVITPADGARVLVVPKPGPPGPAGADGELSAEDRAALVDDVAADLEPPISLVLLFQNGLA